MHISDFLSRHPGDEDSPNEIIPIAFMLQEAGGRQVSCLFALLERKSRALPEQDNYVPYQEDDFMFLFF